MNDMNYKEIAKWVKVCPNANCSTDNHNGCPYGDESLIDCVDRLHVDYELMLDKIERGELAEVVKCNKCIHVDYSDSGEGTLYCTKHGAYFYDDFGCNEGERRTHESD